MRQQLSSILKNKRDGQPFLFKLWLYRFVSYLNVTDSLFSGFAVGKETYFLSQFIKPLQSEDPQLQAFQPDYDSWTKESVMDLKGLKELNIDSRMRFVLSNSGSNL